MSQKRYFQLVESENREAELYIYGDITSWPWQESDVSSYTLSRALQSLDADSIKVYINSYGGEVAEATAIYNQLKNNKAHVTTVCDGFACSAASVVFASGDERLMNKASRLMIHPAMSGASGNAQQLRKAADDLENINELSITAYMENVNISQEELVKMMEEETWIKPEDAVRMGFATGIVSNSNTNGPIQSALSIVMAALDGVRAPASAAAPSVPPAPPAPPEQAEKPEKKTVSTFLDALSKR